ncbi:MAG: DNA mismatch repair endonuclease MutL [Oscillospiraceae bacterium]|nr:DNA mismatch repair endonuclease MutL [Oscillospiraceae bacterium]
MPNIIQLDRHTSDLIAAGEVVERPASVVKELVENAMDAGASQITVEIRSGGMAYIRVTDNGSGILPDEVETAFLRHATSKLRDAKGLEAIATLGFRGEALAAISAVSRMEVLTCCSDDGEGRRVLNEGGRIVSNEPFGCPRGTTMIVRDLFFNTPARLKFMKTDRAEGSAVTGAVIKAALSDPSVSVKYVKDGSVEFHTPGDGRPESCIYALFGRDFFNGLLPVSLDDGTVSVTGYISRPSHVKGNRSSQFFFVNGRSVHSRTLQAVLEQAYRNNLFTGRFPACVLFIRLGYGSVDVNVHPTKREVKFSNEKAVNDAVYYAALGALEQARPIADSPKASASPAPAPVPLSPVSPLPRPAKAAGSASPGGGFASMSAEEFRRRTGASGGFRATGKEPPSGTPLPRKAPPPPVTETFSAPREDPDQARLDLPVPPAPLPEAAAGTAAEDGPGYRVIGEALQTYILVEQGDSLWLIDKHAAHERMQFDRLKAQDRETMVQPLLLPVICSFSPEDTDLLLEHEADLGELGFSVESFGRGRLAVRQLPSHVRQDDAETVLNELCAVFRRGGRPEDSRSDRILATMACKSAVKAGSVSDPEELALIAEKVMSGEIRYCPHGRPVAVEFSRTALDKSFKRT